MDNDLLIVLSGLAALYFFTSSSASPATGVSVAPGANPTAQPGLTQAGAGGGSIDPTGQYAPGCTVFHQAFTGLDACSMAQAVWCSWVGAYGPDPTYWPDPNFATSQLGYWMGFNHYGAYSDGICRAGWNAYMEARMLNPGPSANVALADQPAVYNPSNTVLPAGLAGIC